MLCISCAVCGVKFSRFPLATHLKNEHMFPADEINVAIIMMIARTTSFRTIYGRWRSGLGRRINTSSDTQILDLHSRVVQRIAELRRKHILQDPTIQLPGWFQEESALASANDISIESIKKTLTSYKKSLSKSISLKSPRHSNNVLSVSLPSFHRPSPFSDSQKHAPSASPLVIKFKNLPQAYTSSEDNSGLNERQVLPKNDMSKTSSSMMMIRDDDEYDDNDNDNSNDDVDDDDDDHVGIDDCDYDDDNDVENVHTTDSNTVNKMMIDESMLGSQSNGVFINSSSSSLPSQSSSLTSANDVLQGAKHFLTESMASDSDKKLSRLRRTTPSNDSLVVCICCPAAHKLIRHYLIDHIVRIHNFTHREAVWAAIMMKNCSTNFDLLFVNLNRYRTTIRFRSRNELRQLHSTVKSKIFESNPTVANQYYWFNNASSSESVVVSAPQEANKSSISHANNSSLSMMSNNNGNVNNYNKNGGIRNSSCFDKEENNNTSTSNENDDAGSDEDFIRVHQKSTTNEATDNGNMQSPQSLPQNFLNHSVSLCAPLPFSLQSTPLTSILSHSNNTYQLYPNIKYSQTEVDTDQAVFNQDNNLTSDKIAAIINSNSNRSCTEVSSNGDSSSNTAFSQKLNKSLTNSTGMSSVSASIDAVDEFSAIRNSYAMCICCSSNISIRRKRLSNHLMARHSFSTEHAQWATLIMCEKSCLFEKIFLTLDQTRSSLRNRPQSNLRNIHSQVCEKILSMNPSASERFSWFQYHSKNGPASESSFDGGIVSSKIPILNNSVNSSVIQNKLHLNANLHKTGDESSSPSPIFRLKVEPNCEQLAANQSIVNNSNQCDLTSNSNNNNLNNGNSFIKSLAINNCNNNNKVVNTNNLNLHDDFCMEIANNLRRMPEHLADYAKIRIHELVYNIRYGSG